MRRQHITLNCDEDESHTNTSSNRTYERRKSKKKKKVEKKEREEESLDIDLNNDEEEDDEFNVAKERKKTKKDMTAVDSSDRDKRKTQFPNRFSVFALTSMRASVMNNNSKKNKRISRMKEMEVTGEEDQKKSKKKILLIRLGGKKKKDENGEFKDQTMNSLGLNEAEMQDLLSLSKKPKDETEKEWKRKTRARALELLKSTGEDCDVLFVDDEEIECNDDFQPFTLHNNKGGSITFLEEVDGEFDENGNLTRIIRGLGVLNFLSRVHVPSPSISAWKEERKRKEIYQKGFKSQQVPSIKKSKSASFLRFGKKKFEGKESDDDEGPPTTHMPYYHNLDRDHVKVANQLFDH